MCESVCVTVRMYNECTVCIGVGLVCESVCACVNFPVQLIYPGSSLLRHFSVSGD